MKNATFRTEKYGNGNKKLTGWPQQQNGEEGRISELEGGAVKITQSKLERQK